jgi:hypothetical protein
MASRLVSGDTCVTVMVSIAPPNNAYMDSSRKSET